MFLKIIRLGLGSLIILTIIACINRAENNVNTARMKKNEPNTCKYYRYDAGQIVSKLSCKSCHLSADIQEKDNRGWPTFKGLANMDSLQLVNYVFVGKHEVSYTKKGGI